MAHQGRTTSRKGSLSAAAPVVGFGSFGQSKHNKGKALQYSKGAQCTIELDQHRHRLEASIIGTTPRQRASSCGYKMDAVPDIVVLGKAVDYFRRRRLVGCLSIQHRDQRTPRATTALHGPADVIIQYYRTIAE